MKFVEDNVNIKTPEEIDEELIKAFAKFDANENHQIDQEEFRNILTSHTMGDDPLTKDEADELLNSLDVDGDGQLNVLGSRQIDSPYVILICINTFLIYRIFHSVKTKSHFMRCLYLMHMRRVNFLA